MGDPVISVSVALLMTAGSSLLTVGIAAGVMRAKIAAQEKASADSAKHIDDNFARVEKKQDQIDRDLREGFNRIAALERGAVTQEAFADFRKEMADGFRDLRALIETLRAAPRARKTAEE